MSASSVRGYLSKSSFGPNCSRLTKMLATTGSPCWRARRISDRWPSCRLPMVGTKAVRFWPRNWSRNSWIELMTFMIGLEIPGAARDSVGAKNQLFARPAVSLVMTGSERGIVVDLSRWRTETKHSRRFWRMRAACGARIGTWFTPSCRQIGKAHIDRCERFGLSDFDERFAAQFEHGNEIHDHHRYAFARVEQVGELHEARILQLPQDRAHVLAHRQFLARNLVILDQLRALDHVGPRGAQVFAV